MNIVFVRVIGQRDDIGIFIWSTGSVMDKQLSDGFSAQNLSLSPNSTKAISETS